MAFGAGVPEDVAPIIAVAAAGCSVVEVASLPEVVAGADELEAVIGAGGSAAGAAAAVGVAVRRGVGAYFSTVSKRTIASLGAGTSPFRTEA